MTESEGIEGLARLEKETPFEAALMADMLARTGVNVPEGVWTAGRVRALPDEEILARLTALGLSTSEPSFREAFAQAWAIWDTAEQLWLPHLPPQASLHDRDFVRLAACVLHERWLPDTPRFWQMLKPRLPSRLFSGERIADLVGKSELYFTWGSDFSTAAMNVARSHPELAAPAAAVLGELLSRLAKADESWELSLRGDHAVLLDAAGRREEAEQLLRRLREEYPQQSAGYALQADLWSREGAAPEQIQRALRLLEEAAARPGLDATDWDMNARRQRVRRALAGR